MKKNQLSKVWLSLAVASALSAPVFAQEANPPSDQGAKAAAQTPVPARRTTTTIVANGKQKASGIIAQRDPDSFILRQEGGGDLVVKLVNNTEVREKKGNPFRGSKKYAITQLVRGLAVEVEGRPDSSGALVAQTIRFTNDSLKVAEVVESRVTPVENRLGSAETRLGASEQNAQRLSGQIEELNTIANAAKGGARVAQQTADSAVAGVNAANERITALDDYDPVKSATVSFKVGSSVLSPEAKGVLDELANQAKSQKAFVIEVTGFASSEGGAELNRRLSDRRAQAVLRYLAENHDIPLRRIVTPFGYGDLHPVGDNHTRAGRQENRRVEIKILVNRGLMMSASMNPPAVGQPEAAKPDQSPNQ